MYANIRSCRYCADNACCGTRYKLREMFKDLPAIATAVVNCKSVRPFYQIGERANFSAWEGEKSDDNKTVLSGIVVGYIPDRYGHPRTYAVKVKRAFRSYFEDREGFPYWGDANDVKDQFPDSQLKEDEILVFVKYCNMEAPFDGKKG